MMPYLLAGLLIVTVIYSGYASFQWWLTYRRAGQSETLRQSSEAALSRAQGAWQDEKGRLAREIQRLRPWAGIANADDRAEAILQEAEKARTLAHDQCVQIVAGARAAAEEIQTESRRIAGRARAESESTVTSALDRAAKIVVEASIKASELAGSALEIKQNADLYTQTERAMRNRIQGYGDEYLVPADSMLDDLADDFSHADAGVKLKQARAHSKLLVKQGRASACGYMEASRREGAESFVLDAFNGRVDSILSRVKHDNAGKLGQEIKDAFSLTNYGGKAFRDARITPEYVAARLDELHWAAVVQELRRIELEEQRAIREQIREEEKARREFERAIREAAKQEQMLRTAMAKAEAQVATANEGQRAKFEAQLAELSSRLKDAEDRGQRATSMAQQTRRGHVYIVSNVGSFGDDVYKIGLTRRLEPLDRIRELGDASVPFEFDVHAMIHSEDAPRLECELHKHFLLNQINKVNHRKEFFRASLLEIRKEIETLGLATKWTMAAEARSFRETQAIEHMIASDPAARRDWLNRQLELDPTELPDPRDVGADEEDEDLP